ncbi:MAG: 2-oxoacid:ferredoxin oxidoreductase subunit beta [Chloroflexota bacterium]
MTAQQTVHIREYLRPKKRFPSVWCPGCGIGVALGALLRAISSLGISKDDIALVSGIGCTGRMPVYADFGGLHTTHGRALAFATGLKLARPELKVITIMGDGDALAIGGNHFIHAARRNIDLTAIVVNNSIYGLTGGQYSPTTPFGAITETSTYGHVEQPFDTVKLAQAAGAPFVARGTVFHVVELVKLLGQALKKKGFSVVEVISNCHVHYGKLNQMGQASEMLRWQRDNTIAVSQVKGDDARGKIVRGVLVDRELPEYLEAYQSLVARVQGREDGRG